MDVQQLPEGEQATYKYSGQMEQSDTLLNERLYHKNNDINIASVTDWNWLFIDKLNPEFDNEFYRVTNDDVPHN